MATRSFAPVFFLSCMTLVVHTRGALAQEQELLYVGNNHGGTISVIDVASLSVLGEFNAMPDAAARKVFPPTGFVDDLVASPDGRILYVSRASLGDVAAFSTATEELLWRVPIPGTPDHFALSRDGRRLYLSVISRRFSLVIDTDKRAPVAWWETGMTPHGMFLSPDEQRVYTGCIRCDQITIAAANEYVEGENDAQWTGLAGLDHLRVLRTIQFENGVRPFVITPDEQRLFVQLSKLHGFVVVDIESGRITRTVELPVPPGVTHQKTDPHTAHHGMALLPGGEHLCVAGTVADYVAILSVPDLELLGTVPVGREPSWVIASLDGRHCYASARKGNSVSVIAVDERRELKRIPVGDYPQRMWTVRVPERRVVQSGG